MMPSLQDYEKCLQNLQNKPKHKFGVLGKLLAAVFSIGGGSLAAINFVGTPTVFGSEILGGILGGIIGVSTPIGWIAVGAIAATIATYGISKLIYNGGMLDKRTETIIEELEKKIFNAKNSIGNDEDKTKYDKLLLILGESVQNNFLQQNEADEFIEGVSNGALTYEFVYTVLAELTSNISNNHTCSNCDYEKEVMKRLSSVVFKKTLTEYSYIDNTMMDIYYKYFQDKFDLNQYEAERLFYDTPVNMDINELVFQITNSFPESILLDLYQDIVKITNDNGIKGTENNNFLAMFSSSFKTHASPKTTDFFRFVVSNEEVKKKLLLCTKTSRGRQ